MTKRYVTLNELQFHAAYPFFQFLKKMMDMEGKESVVLEDLKAHSFQSQFTAAQSGSGLGMIFTEMLSVGE